MMGLMTSKPLNGLQMYSTVHKLNITIPYSLDTWAILVRTRLPGISCDRSEFMLSSAVGTRSRYQASMP